MKKFQKHGLKIYEEIFQKVSNLCVNLNFISEITT